MLPYIDATVFRYTSSSCPLRRLAQTGGGVECPRGAQRGDNEVQTYSAAFRAKMVQRMAGPAGRTAANLSKEIGVSQTSLSKVAA